MGSSYRTALNYGHLPEWEDSLRRAVQEIRSVADQVERCIGEDGQYDNAADDGALAALLRHAVQIVLAELPERNKQ